MNDTRDLDLEDFASQIERLRAELDEARLNPSPSVWPACSECNEAFQLERRMQMQMEGEAWQIRPIWAWIRACKHKKADAYPCNDDGPVTTISPPPAA